MSNAIGRMIGIIDHAFKVTNDNKAEVQLSVKIDFSSASDQDIKNWLVSNRVIAGQRPWRSLSQTELLDLHGMTFIAQDIGKKVKSRQEKIDLYVTNGFTETMAVAMVDGTISPEKQAAIDAILNGTDEDEDDSE